LTKTNDGNNANDEHVQFIPHINVKKTSLYTC